MQQTRGSHPAYELCDPAAYFRPVLLTGMASGSRRSRPGRRTGTAIPAVREFRDQPRGTRLILTLMSVSLAVLPRVVETRSMLSWFVLT